jgi:hypothetical protein
MSTTYSVLQSTSFGKQKNVSGWPILNPTGFNAASGIEIAKKIMDKYYLTVHSVSISTWKHTVTLYTSIQSWGINLHHYQLIKGWI